MIRNNLAKLLADRSLKITKVANDTGISRNTITNTAQNDGKMIQLETINTLCQYLQITPGQLFEFLPFDLSFSTYFDDFKIASLGDGNLIESIVISPFQADAFMKKTSNNQLNGKLEKSFDFTIQSFKEIKFIRTIDSDYSLHLFDTIPVEIILNDEDNTDDFDKLWNDDLTAGFRTTIIQEIQNKVFNDITEKINNDLNKSYNFLNLTWEPSTFKLKFAFKKNERKINGDLPPQQIEVTLKSKEIDISNEDLPF